MHAPSLAVQLPSSLQRALLRQSALPWAAHLPSTTLQRPSFAHALDCLQASAFATQRPPSAAHSARSLQASDFWHSALDPATQRPPSATHSPSRAQGLSFSGFSSLVPAQCWRDSATQATPFFAHKPSLVHFSAHSACSAVDRSTQLPW